MADKKTQYDPYSGYGGDCVLRCSQAVKVCSAVETAGQGGWNAEGEFPHSTIGDEINQACENIEMALQSVGACWKQVWSVTSYHVGPISEEVVDAMLFQFASRCPRGTPLWTAVEVKGLRKEQMRVELVAKADCTENAPAPVGMYSAPPVC